MAKICPKCTTSVSGHLSTHCSTCTYGDGSLVPLITEEQHQALEAARDRFKKLADDDAVLEPDPEPEPFSHAGPSGYALM